MAISVLPPTELTREEQGDISTLLNIIISFATILDHESAIEASANTMTSASIASLNQTLTDASDRIDATINPSALP